MEDNERFELIIIDGAFQDFVYDLGQPYLRFSDLTWTNAVDLCRLSFDQGFQCIIWRPVREEREADGEAKGSTEL